MLVVVETVPRGSGWAVVLLMGRWGAWGGSVLVMERILHRRLPDWSMCVLGWQRTFFQAVLGGMREE